MGFCGIYCPRGRADFDFLGAADEIAQNFESQSPEADEISNIIALEDLLNFIKRESQTGKGHERALPLRLGPKTNR